MSATFEAANNVIRVRDTNGAVVFDTGTPMPHIAQVITASISHSFAACGFRKFPDSDYGNSRTGVSVNTGQGFQ